MDAFAQNNGHLGVTDSRDINTLKLFLNGISPLEYLGQIHSMSNYNKDDNGFHSFPKMLQRVWYRSVLRSFFDDAFTADPFEVMISIGFAFE